MRAFVFTASGHRNLWDELILAQEVRLLARAFPGIECVCATYDPASMLVSDVRTIGYFPHAIRRHPWKNILIFLRTLVETARADLVIFGGGGLVYDNEPGQSFRSLRLQWLLRVMVAKFLRKPVFWCAVWVYVSPEHRETLCSLFHGTRVSVRDEASQQTLREIGIEADLLPDPVHLYEPLARSDSKSRFVGIALRGGYAADDESLLAGLVAWLRERGFEPVLISHSFHGEDRVSNDHLSYRAIANRLGVTITVSMQESLEWYPRLHSMIAMRLHANILSFVHALPFVGVSYSTKTDALLDRYNHAYRVCADDTSPEEIFTVFDRLESSHEEARLALMRDSDTMRTNLSHTLERFLTNGLEETARRRYQ